MCRLHAVGSQGRLRIVGSWGDPRETILLVVLGCSPSTDSVKKMLLLGPKGNQALVGPSNCVVFFASFALFFVNVLALFFASFEITKQLTLHRKFSSFCLIQMQNDQIYKGQVYFYHAKWPQTIQKLSLFVHIIYMTTDSQACN